MTKTVQKTVEEKNRNYNRIEKQLIDAYMELCSKKHPDMISITELCKEAGVNRTTFYKHFEGTWQVKETISVIICNAAEQLHNSFKGRNFLKESYSIFCDINKEIHHNFKFFKSVFSMRDSNIYTDIIINKIKEMIEIDPSRKEAMSYFPYPEVAFYYFLGGIVNTYHEWFEGNIDCTLDELAKRLSQFVESAVAMLVKQ